MSDDRIRVLARESRAKADGSWQTREAEHSALRPTGVTVDEAIRMEFEVLDRAIRESWPVEQQVTEVKPKPTLDPAELGKLDWRSYREGSRAAWTFADKAPASLLEQLEKGPVELGEFRYRYSGPAESPKLFVSRAPVKE